MVTVGSLVSTFTVTESLEVLPARSVQDAVTCWAPSPAEVVCWVQFAGSMPAPASVQFQSTVTALSFQPAAFAAGLRAGLADGPTASVKVIVTRPFPARVPSDTSRLLALASTWLEPPPPPPPEFPTPRLVQTLEPPPPPPPK